MIDPYYFDSIPDYYSLEPVYSCLSNDSIFTYNYISTRISDTVFPLLRLYDSNFKRIKERKISNDLLQEAQAFLPLKNGNFIVGALNMDHYTGHVSSSSFYLYDHQIDPVAWPTQLPQKGYDWACNISAMHYYELIDMDTVVTPIYIAPDYSEPDWQALGIKPDRQAGSVISEDEKWLACPQPLTPGNDLYFIAINAENTNPFSRLSVCFTDIGGHDFACRTAISMGSGKWVVKDPGIKNPGMYLGRITNISNGKLIGTIKIMVTSK